MQVSRQAGKQSEIEVTDRQSIPASWSARGGSKGKCWWWWRTGRGGARAGALLALRIKAEESRESPVEQLRRAGVGGRVTVQRDIEAERERKKESGKRNGWNREKRWRVLESGSKSREYSLREWGKRGGALFW